MTSGSTSVACAVRVCSRLRGWRDHLLAGSLSILVLATSSPLLTSCRSVYYSTMESLGRHKRDLLVSRVEAARDDQEEAKEQFQSALEQFTSVVTLDEGTSNLKAQYDKLNGELQRCEGKAEDVRERIDSIETVAGDLFKEWQGELEQYSNQDLRRRSEEQLEKTELRYEQLIGAMHRAEAKMEPVLVAFRDQVLFIKHNLNAQAIASLQGEVVTLESDIGDLVKEMEAAIVEANAFISTMGEA